MKMVLLTGKVEISDQYGTSKTIFIGVFNSQYEGTIQKAKDKFNKDFCHTRTVIRERVIDLNQYYGVSHDN